MTTSEEEMGRELRESNEKIVHCLMQLKEQRGDLAFLIEKQYEERKKLETELERITYKLCLINKSLAQRVLAKENYDRTIGEIELKYKTLVENSGKLLFAVQKEYDQLDSVLNKKTSTEETPTNEKKGSIIYPQQTHSAVAAPCSVEKDCACKDKKVSYGREAQPREPNGSEIELPTKLGKHESESMLSISNVTPATGAGRERETDLSDDEMGSSLEEDRSKLRR